MGANISPANPTSQWTAQQVTEAFPFDENSGYMFIDGGADCHCSYCESHRAEVILGALNMAGELLADV